MMNNYKKIIFVLALVMAISVVSQSFAASKADDELSITNTRGFLSAYRSLIGGSTAGDLIDPVAKSKPSAAPAPISRPWVNIPVRPSYRSPFLPTR
jgi:hypothetical protein